MRFLKMVLMGSVMRKFFFGFPCGSYLDGGAMQGDGGGPKQDRSLSLIKSAARGIVMGFSPDPSQTMLMILLRQCSASSVSNGPSASALWTASCMMRSFLSSSFRSCLSCDGSSALPGSM